MKSPLRERNAPAQPAAPPHAADSTSTDDMPRRHFGAASHPIYQTSLFTFRNFAEMADAFAGRPHGPIYTRGDNPTVAALERAVADLEGAETARAFASGMGAISATVIALLPPSGRIVTVRNVYSDAYRLFEKILGPLGIETVYIDGADGDAVEAALEGASLLFLENPTSLTFELQDIARLAAAAQRAGAVSMIDNSWATPVFQTPLDHGVDIVVHAASKYLSGHSDTVAGVVAGPRELIERINQSTFPYFGAKLSPFDAWLILRGLDTLELRLKRHETAGLQVADYLARHEAVERILHPAFRPRQPGHGSLAGHSGLFAVILRDTIDVPAFVDALNVFGLGVSWGGPESLVVPAKAILHQPKAYSAFHAFGVHPRLVRVNVGLEPVPELIGDLEQALRSAAR